MYSIRDYGFMIRDDVRTGAYAEALRRVVTPDAVVVDIGTGTGIFALLACRYGARRVYAIEPEGMIEMARAIAADNGYADRITFIEEVSSRVTLPERADVIVSDLPAYSHIEVIVDARERFLAPGGRLLPQRDTLCAALVHAPEAHVRRTVPWLENPYNLDMRAAGRLLENVVERRTFEADQLLSAPVRPTILDYTAIERPAVHAKCRLVADRAGTAHGAAVWFDVMVSDGVCFSNEPGAARRSALNRSLYFPFADPVAVVAGDELEFKVVGHSVNGRFLWNWMLTPPAGTGAGPRGPAIQS
jgi:protein arginine N-methyltransferase 1